MRKPSDKLVVPVSKAENAPIFHQYLAGFTCSLLAFIYGNTIGWTSSAVPQLQEGILPLEGPVSRVNAGWVGGALCVGGLISSPFHGLLADAKGRKFAAYVIGIAFVLNWSFILAGDRLWCILVGRFFCGIGAAGSVTVISIYNNEVGELRLKASLGGLMTMAYAVGILFAYALGIFISYTNVIIVHLCTSVIFLPAWWFMPESPAYEVLNGNDKDALRVLRWLLGSKGPHAQDAFDRLKKEQAGAVQSVTIKQFFQDPAATRGLLYATTMIATQTFSGMFALQSYAGSILSGSGGGLSPAAGIITFGSLMVAGSICPPLVADKLPRRVMLGLSCGLLSIGMVVLATFQYLQSQGWDLSNPDSFVRLIPTITLCTTIFFHYIGLGSVVYVSIVELFTDETRGVGGTFVAVCMWSTSFFLLQFYGVAVEALGNHVVFYFFSSVCAFGVFFVCVFLPETRRKSVEEISAILGKRRRK